MNDDFQVDLEQEVVEGEREGEREIEIPTIDAGRYIEGVGRRKEAVARVRLFANEETRPLHILVASVSARSGGSEKSIRSYQAYFPVLEFQKIVDAPIRKLKLHDKYLVKAVVRGGGFRGQAEAIRHGLARALVKLNPEWRVRMKRSGFLTRDPRVVERKKYGLKKARRSPQWSKR